jgi:hypothetical protein
MTTTTQPTDTGTPPVNQSTEPSPAPSPDPRLNGAGPGTASAPLHLNGELAGRLLRSARWQQ